MFRMHSKDGTGRLSRPGDGVRRRPPAGHPVLFEVTVVPRTGRADVEKTGDRAYRVRVTSSPEGGRANREVLRLLARAWGVPPSSLAIVRGEKSRRKTIACRDPRIAE